MASADDTTTSYDPEALHKKYLEERDKRLRKEAEGQYIEATGEYEEFVKDPYINVPLERSPTMEDIDVAIIGGGFGGLLTAAGLHKSGISSLKIIELGGDFGGTWYWNRYPGVRCDIESLIYMPLLEELGTLPTMQYVTGEEIFNHCKAIGEHFDLYDRTLFQTKVTKIIWNESTSRWHLETNRGDQIRAKFVSVSQGPLAKVKLPGIPGIKSFKGKMFHSSRWDYDYTGGNADGGLTKLKTERVAVIGTGATSVQIAPALAEHSKHLYIFQRTPSAIDARNNKPMDKSLVSDLGEGWQRKRMDNFLSIVSGIPQKEDMVCDQWTDFWKRFGALMKERHDTGSDTSPDDLMQRVDYEKMEELRARISKDINDPDTVAAAMPWYNYLCKRPLFSDNFLEVFNRDNVFLIDTDGHGVEKISESGIVANGKEYKVDCIIYATGFDVGAAAHKVGGYELIGRNGITLDEKWVTGMRSLHGTQLNGFPNFHIVGGVAQGTTAFNFTHILAMQADHAVDLITRCMRDGINTMEVTKEAEERWLTTMEDKYVDHMKFYEECTPGFLNNEGDFKDRPTFVGSTYGGGPLEYEKIIQEWRKSNVDNDTVVTTKSGS